MLRAGRIGLSATAAAAIALASCSGSSAAPPGNNAGPQADGNRQKGGGVLTDDQVGEVAQSLCTESARQRYGIAPADVTGFSWIGGGETRQSISGQMTIILAGPPERLFQCALAGGAVSSVVEVDEHNNPIATRR